MEAKLVTWLRAEAGELLEKDECSCLALICQRTVELPPEIDAIMLELTGDPVKRFVLCDDLASRALNILSTAGLGGVKILTSILMIEDEKTGSVETAAPLGTLAPRCQSTFVDVKNPTLERSLELLRAEFVTLAQQLQQQPSTMSEAHRILVRLMTAWAALLYQGLVHLESEGM